MILLINYLHMPGNFEVQINILRTIHSIIENKYLNYKIHKNCNLNCKTHYNICVNIHIFTETQK